MLRRLLQGCLALTLLIGMTGVFAQQSSETLEFALSAEPPMIDPHVASGTAARTVVLTLYRGLFSYDEDGQVREEMVANWSQPDERTYVFELQSGLTFHDGAPVTAEDVVYSFERILDPAVGAKLFAVFQNVESVEALDELTVQVRLSTVVGPFIDYLATPEGAIVSEAWMQDHDVRREANGTGPFRLVSFEPGVRIVVERNDAYYKEGLPYLDRIDFGFYPDDDARITAMQSLTVDVIEYVPWRAIDAMISNPGIEYLGGVGPFMYLQFNTKVPPFDDARVRRAMGYAINRDNVLAAAFFGHGDPLYGVPTISASWAYDEEFANYWEFDPEKARDLLAEAGYEDGFSATLLSTSTYGMHQHTAEVVAAELIANLGLDIELRLLEWSTRIEEGLAENYHFAVNGSTGDVIDPDFYTRFVQTSETSIVNSPGFSDPIIDGLLARGRSTVDLEERVEIYAELQRRMLELAPLVPLNWREQGYAHLPTVSGFHNLPGFLSFFSGITLETTRLDR